MDFFKFLPELCGTKFYLILHIPLEIAGNASFKDLENLENNRTNIKNNTIIGQTHWSKTFFHSLFIVFSLYNGFITL